MNNEKEEMALAAMLIIISLLIGLFIGAIVNDHAKTTRPAFGSCVLDLSPLTVTGSDGRRWHQVTEGIVGCSASGISVLVPEEGR